MKQLALVLLVAALAGAAFVPPGPVRAQTRASGVRPWTPPGADTIQVWAAEVRAALRAQPTDSIDAATKTAYDRLGGIAWRFLRSLGRARVGEIAAVESALDSLGFDTDLVADPVISSFVFLVARNPHRLDAHAMGYFFWYRGDRLMMQAMALPGGRKPLFRVWWNNEAEAPYVWGLLDRARDGRMGMHLLRMTSDGGFWRPFQWPGHGPDLDGAYEAVWVDLDRDLRPELKTWSRATPDPLFAECPGCPPRLIERTYADRRRAGFELIENRVMATPYATFTDFVRALVNQDRSAAARCVAKPQLVDEARKLGWGSRRADSTWALERFEQERWPRWLGLKFSSSSGPKRYVVRFTEEDGRWLIESWTQAAADSTAAGQRE